MHVILVTSVVWPGLFDDDHPLRDALVARGLEVSVRVWDDPAAEWGDADMVVLRSIWDYTAKRDRFVSWVHGVEDAVPVHNPANIVEWNSHKRYLRDLQDRGVPVVPTEWLDAGSAPDVRAITAARGWTGELVVKPSVSAGARGAVRGDVARIAEVVDELLPHKDLMVQPYLAATEAIGEHSLVHFGGRLSHVVRKEPALAVEDYSSSRVVPTEPHPDEVRLAEQVLQITGPLLYARVDTIVIEDVAHVMEVELIEPQLFFRAVPGSEQTMADLIAARA